MPPATHSHFVDARLLDLRPTQMFKSPLERYLPGWSGVMLAPVEVAR